MALKCKWINWVQVRMNSDEKMTKKGSLMGWNHCVHQYQWHETIWCCSIPTSKCHDQCFLFMAQPEIHFGLQNPWTQRIMHSTVLTLPCSHAQAPEPAWIELRIKDCAKGPVWDMAAWNLMGSSLDGLDVDEEFNLKIATRVCVFVFSFCLCHNRHNRYLYSVFHVGLN